MTDLGGFKNVLDKQNPNSYMRLPEVSHKVENRHYSLENKKPKRTGSYVGHPTKPDPPNMTIDRVLFRA